MARPHLQGAFSHLLPILNETDYIVNPMPIANSTALDNAADELNTTFLHNVLGNATNILLSNDDSLPSRLLDLTDHEEPSDSGIVLSALTFYSGRKRGQQCSYNGYLYAHNKSRPNGHRYWDCKDRKQYTPPCKGRLTTLGSAMASDLCHTHHKSEHGYDDLKEPSQFT